VEVIDYEPKVLRCASPITASELRKDSRMSNFDAPAAHLVSNDTDGESSDIHPLIDFINYVAESIRRMDQAKLIFMKQHQRSL
jgi:hypothetical protein